MKAKGAPKAKIMSGKVVDWVIIALTAVFALQHPAVKPYAYLERPVSELVSYTQEYARNTTVALQAPEGRKALFKSWFHYVIGSDIAGVGAGPEAADPKLQHFYQLNEWKNSLLLPQSVRDQVPHVAAIWLRNYVAIHLVYFGIGGLWAFVIYIVLADKFFPKDAKTGQRARPDWPAISEQVWVGDGQLKAGIRLTLSIAPAGSNLTPSTAPFPIIAGIDEGHAAVRDDAYHRRMARGARLDPRVQHAGGGRRH